MKKSELIGYPGIASMVLGFLALIGNVLYHLAQWNAFVGIPLGMIFVGFIALITAAVLDQTEAYR